MMRKMTLKRKKKMMWTPNLGHKEGLRQILMTLPMMLPWQAPKQ